MRSSLELQCTAPPISYDREMEKTMYSGGVVSALRTNLSKDFDCILHDQ